MLKTTNGYRDGQSIEFYILPKLGRHNGLGGSFRPMLFDETETISREVGEKSDDDPKLGAAIICKVIAARLVSWSEVNSSGAPVAITPEAVNRLPATLVNRLYGIVMNMADSDPLPSEASESDQIEKDRQLDAILNPSAPTKAAEGNS